jgi:tRNA1Val (adenine37-N6)-methyltransferase
MKVCTDACILGAWAALDKANKILDIGTGTGLLALMLAQRTTANITAVELDNQAYEQAKFNISQSTFATQIELWHGAVQVFAQITPAHTFSHIVVNPPFYENHLLSVNPQRNTALHSQTLSFTELLDAIDRLLSLDGQCFVLLPSVQSQQLAALALHKNLFVKQQLLIKHQENKSIFRVITVFCRQKNAAIKTEILNIKTPQQAYTAQFMALLKDYYLIF